MGHKKCPDIGYVVPDISKIPISGVLISGKYPISSLIVSVKNPDVDLTDSDSDLWVVAVLSTFMVSFASMIKPQ